MTMPTDGGAKPNRLIDEKSPYLLQHAHNPVDWYPWGSAAFEKARFENKPIFLSVGYSTCHWCHVMAHESFEDREVADLLNRYFVAVKLDREERPDIDQLYMSIVVTLNGGGGWPMSVFLTPDLKPFYGATYFPRKDFVNILARIHLLWQSSQESLLRSADELFGALRSQRSPAPEGIPGETVFHEAFAELAKEFDDRHGGFGPAPRFPPSRQVRFLLRRYRKTGEQAALDMAETTLDNMARGGMYDHLGGGFHRYSVDDRWLVPHFEKMLYDNANLSLACIEAFRLTKKQQYALIAREILDYVLRDMQDPAGGFYSAEDADSEGAEGTYYIWKKDEFDAAAGGGAARFAALYGVTDAGNFEGRNILSLQEGFDWQAKYGPEARSTHEALLAARAKRPRPFRDEKVVTESNGLMINSLAAGYQALGDKRYLEAAQRAARFIRDTLYAGGALKRHAAGGRAAEGAVLDDYAFLIQGLITLYESDFNEEWISWAIELQKIQDRLFGDAAEGGYFYSAEDRPDVIVRLKDFPDGANPSANAVSVLNLLRLYHLTYDESYKAAAENIFRASAAWLKRAPAAMAQTLIALEFYLDGGHEAAIVTKDGRSLPEALASLFYTSFSPDTVLALKPEGLPSALPLLAGKKLAHASFTAYVCRPGSCGEPTDDVLKIGALVRPAP